MIFFTELSEGHAGSPGGHLRSKLSKKLQFFLFFFF